MRRLEGERATFTCVQLVCAPTIARRLFISSQVDLTTINDAPSDFLHLNSLILHIM